MTAPTDRQLVSRRAIPMTSPAVRSLGLKVIFRSKSFLPHMAENTMDIMPKTARLSVKKP